MMYVSTCVDAVANEDVHEPSASGPAAESLRSGDTWTGDAFLVTPRPLRFRREDWP